MRNKICKLDKCKSLAQGKLELEINVLKWLIKELVVWQHNVSEYIKCLETNTVLLAKSNKELEEFKNAKKLANTITIRIWKYLKKIYTEKEPTNIITKKSTKITRVNSNRVSADNCV